jgi:hypothetical protein
MTDRELLEAAARAAGLDFTAGSGINIDRPGFTPKASTCWQGWNPLLDDGDALRLAVKLGITIYPPECEHDDPTTTWGNRHDAGQWITEPRGADPLAATRRAIVRAAAAIGSGR